MPTGVILRVCFLVSIASYQKLLVRRLIFFDMIQASTKYPIPLHNIQIHIEHEINCRATA